MEFLFLGVLLECANSGTSGRAVSRGAKHRDFHDL